MEELLQQYWPILLAALSGVVWLVRVEGLVKTNEKAIETQHNDTNKRIDGNATDIKELTDVRITVGEMKSTLEALKDQVQVLVTYFIKNKK